MPVNGVKLIGREAELKEVDEQLSSGDMVILVSAIGGVGKTELCKSYFNKYKTKYNSAIWIDYKGSLKESFANQCKLDSFIEDDNIDQRFEKVIKYYEDENNSNSLIIIDNVDNEEDQSLLQITNLISNNIRILVTSRMVIEGYSTYSLEFLNKDNCKKLFYQYYKRQEDDSNLEKIISLAARHTLIIELLAKTAQNSRISIKKLYEILLDKGFNLNEVIKEKVSMIKDGNIVSEQLFNQLLKIFDLSTISEEEQYILMNLSILPQVGLQELVEWIELETMEEINSLEKKGWISINSVDAKDIIYVHPLIQETIRYQLNPTTDKCVKLIEAIIRALHTRPTDNSLDKKVYTIFGDYILKYIDEETERIATLSNNLSSIYIDLGNLGKSLEYQHKAVDIREKVLGENHPDLATAYNNLSSIYKILGIPEKSPEYQHKAVEIYEEMLGDEHPFLATSYNNLSLIYQDLGEVEKSLEYQKKAVDIREKVLGKKHPDLAISYNNLSMIYRDLGELEKSLEYQQKAVEIYEEMLGKKHPSLATSYNNLSLIYKDFGNMKKSLKYQEKAIEINEKALGENHLYMAISYNNLCSIYQGLGELEKSLEFQLKAIDIAEKVLPSNHPNLLIFRNNLANIYKKIGQVDESQSSHLNTEEVFK